MFEDNIYVMGGYDGGLRSGVSTWNQLTASAAWGARSGHVTEVFDNKLFVLGGLTSSYQNDVWSSSDGITWSLVTDHAEWGVRADHAAAVFDNKLFVMGGNDGSRLNNVWSSMNETTWTQVFSSTPWNGRSVFPTAVLHNKLYVLGGNDDAYLNDVWTMEVNINPSAASEHKSSATLTERYIGTIWVTGNLALLGIW